MIKPEDIDLRELEIKIKDINHLKEEVINCLYSDSIPTKEDLSNINAVFVVTLQEIIPLQENKFKQFLSDKLNEIDKEIDKRIKVLKSASLSVIDLYFAKQIIHSKFTKGGIGK